MIMNRRSGCCTAGTEEARMNDPIPMNDVKIFGKEPNL